jgi:hypothetical protein
MRRPEGEREMSGYLKQKLFQALHDLVGAGDLDQRLTHAGNYLAHVQHHEVPEEHRMELGEIKAIMFATPLSSENSPREISTEDGTKLAHRILELYTKVMGGLQASHPPPWAQGEEMTKAPSEFEPPKPITKAERDARKASRKVDAEKAMTEHEITQKAFSANRERLKTERLTREAAGPPVAAKKAKTKKKPR